MERCKDEVYTEMSKDSKAFLVIRMVNSEEVLFSKKKGILC